MEQEKESKGWDGIFSFLGGGFTDRTERLITVRKHFKDGAFKFRRETDGSVKDMNGGVKTQGRIVFEKSRFFQKRMMSSLLHKGTFHTFTSLQITLAEI